MLRSPVMLMAFGASLILAVSLHNGHDFVIEGYLPDLSLLRGNIWNQVISTCKNMFPPFAGLMVSAHILAERKNGFSDVIVGSRKSILSIYLSKLCAVATVAFAARLILFVVKAVWFWGFHYPEAYSSLDTPLTLGEILAYYAVNEVVHVPFMLLGYIAMPVFITIITNIQAAGAVWNVGFYLLSFVSTTFKMSNFNFPPQSLLNYSATFQHIDYPQYMADLQAGLILDSQGRARATFTEALIPYISWIVFSLALLTAAYFILKKRYRE